MITMVYYRQKTIKGHTYWYLQESYREGDKVRTRTIAYIGKELPSTLPENYFISQLENTSEKELGTTIYKIHEDEVYQYTKTLIAKNRRKEDRTVNISKLRPYLKEKIGLTDEEIDEALIVLYEKKKLQLYPGKTQGEKAIQGRGTTFAYIEV